MDSNQQFLSAEKARLKLGVCAKTLRNWDNKGIIKTVRTPGGTRLYDVSSITGSVQTKSAKRDIIYARVSSAKQKPDLERQVESLRQKFPEHQIIRDIGSGINWNRRGLRTLLRYCLEGSLRQVVVAHRDRLSRLGFELFQFLIHEAGGQLLVSDPRIQGGSECDEQLFKSDNGDGDPEISDLGEDLLSIIHVFSCRHYGKRKYSKSGPRAAKKTDEEKSNSRKKRKVDTEQKAQDQADDGTG